MKPRYILALFLYVALAGGYLDAREQVAVAVWKGKACVQLLENVEATAPMIDGQPDLKNVRVKGILLDKKCMSFEVRH